MVKNWISYSFIFKELMLQATDSLFLAFIDKRNHNIHIALE
jgi:hypothetical protein